MSEHKPLSHLVPGQKLGQFTIKSLIGRGTDGEVYRAFNPGLGRDIAIKVYYPGEPKTADFIRQYREEVQPIADLKHPNIIRVYDFNIGSNVCYLAMELIEGVGLRDLISMHHTGLNRDDTIRVFSQIASGIAYAHDQGVVHGNIKPDNVLIDTSKRPVVTDFNVPCLAAFGSSTSRELPSSAAVYMAPEQFAGEHPCPPCDIYLLGILLYEMVTGDVPFKGDTFESIAAQHSKASPKSPSHINIDLDPRIERVILKALEKTPDDRYPTARDMLTDLERREVVNEYDTVTFDRQTAELIRKRRSEIIRFHKSRSDVPTAEIRAVKVKRNLTLPLAVVGIILIIALVVAAVLLI
ncbi:MAG: serine/threonine protein kinase [Anaerolineae bacterium]|nr:serine/threonine protein kinase [Anaerolineae bacterium]